MSFFKRLLGGEPKESNGHDTLPGGAAPVVVTDQNFDEVVIKATQPVVVDFWAIWCGPCKYIHPSVEKMAAVFAGKAIVAKLDVDKNPNTPTTFKIMGIPTLIYFKDGREVARVVGVKRYEELASHLDALL